MVRTLRLSHTVVVVKRYCGGVGYKMLQVFISADVKILNFQNSSYSGDLFGIPALVAIGIIAGDRKEIGSARRQA